MSLAKIKGNLTSRIGRPVRLGAPLDVKRKEGGAAVGIVEDEIWADEAINSSRPHSANCRLHCWGDYSFCSQLIKWDEPSEDGRYSIRLAYYRRRCGEDWWEFAGQTAATSDCATIEGWLRATLKRKDWFRGL